MTSEREEYVAVLKALYDYDPSSQDELAIKEDQLLFLVEKTDDEWWKVKHKPDSQEDETPSPGLVPASYLEEVEPSSIVKALYDYEAVAPGELTVTEDELLGVYGTEEDWLLVKSERDGGKVGYVPGNYVESTGEEEPAENDASRIVIPDSPPSAPYVDPADRVAATTDKAKADDIQTWAVSEVDKKGKKKKGTLGVGNGAIFFASESDKTPVQKWQTSAIEEIKVEKSKHVHLEISGAVPASLHFNVGSKDTADAVVKKLQASKNLAAGPSSRPLSQSGGSPPTSAPLPLSVTIPGPGKPNKNGATVHFAQSPALIPSPKTPLDAEPEEAMEGETGAALYDFSADGEDELSVREGEQLIILDKDSSDEWWKCRNVHGAEGVVPASYIDTVGGATVSSAEAGDDDDDGEAQKRAAREEAERAAREEAERAAAKAEAAAERAAARAEAAAAQARERAEKERDRKAKADRERRAREREREREAAERARCALGDVAVPYVNEEGPKFPADGKTRVWYDHSGQWRTEAEFLGISKGKIRLHKINGVIIEVPPEKMSPNDVRYIENITNKSLTTTSASRPRNKDEDNVPLGALSARKPVQDPVSARPTPSPKKAPTVDWFEFFLNAGCEIDDCSRYASSFERDKIDEAILPDIKESTLRSLGLREGDIIRVTKAIEQRKPKSSSARDDARKVQMARDEEIAKALQAEEDAGPSSRHTNTTSPPPNLFAGPGGALKTRRGRPQPRGTAPPVNVDANSIASASDQISRTGSPLVVSPSVARAASPLNLNPPKPTPSTQPSGFDDDAWTNRPSSTKPLAPTPTPPVSAPAPPPAPTPAAVPSPSPTPQPPVQPAPPTSTDSTGSKQDPGQFELLAKIGQMRAPSAPAPPSSIPRHSSPVIVPPPPQSFHSGLGMGASPLPLGQHLQSQRTGMYAQPLQNGARGPLAPVPANQGLLNPLIPTNTGFNQFVPTRPASNPPFQPSPQPSFLPQGQPAFLSAPPIGFGPNGPLVSQPTGFPGIPQQQTGFPAISAQPTGFGNALATPNFMPPNGYGGVQSNLPGFNPSFSQPSFNNGGLAPPSAPPQKDHSPANVFAQMKSGTFGNDAAPQPADKYDALRPQPTGFQHTFQPHSGF